MVGRHGAPGLNRALCGERHTVALRGNAGRGERVSPHFILGSRYEPAYSSAFFFVVFFLVVFFLVVFFLVVFFLASGLSSASALTSVTLAFSRI